AIGCGLFCEKTTVTARLGSLLEGGGLPSPGAGEMACDRFCDRSKCHRRKRIRENDPNTRTRRLDNDGLARAPKRCCQRWRAFSGILPQGDTGTAQGMKENHLENACLDWLASVGWTVVESETAAPGGELA